MQLLHAKQIAENYGISYPHVLAAIASGELSSMKCGGNYAVEASNAEAWVGAYRTTMNTLASEHWKQTVARLTARVAQLEAQVIALGGSV